MQWRLLLSLAAVVWNGAAGILEARSFPTPRPVVAPFHEGETNVHAAPPGIKPVPARISFVVEPAIPVPGQKYELKVFLENPGDDTLWIEELLVVTSLNGRRHRGPVPPLAGAAKAREKALVLDLKDSWKEDVESWSFAVRIRTTQTNDRRAIEYKNQLDWPAPAPPPAFRLSPTFVKGAPLSGEICFPEMWPTAKPPVALSFVVEPEQPTAGEPYEVRVFLENQERDTLRIGDVVATATIDGKSAAGPVPALVREVPSGERVLLFQIEDVWKAPMAWALAVRVRTVHGRPDEQTTIYESTLNWH